MDLKLPVTLTVVSPMYWRGVPKIPGDTIKVDDPHLVNDMQSAFSSQRVVVTVDEHAREKIDLWKKRQAEKAETKAVKKSPAAKKE